MKWSFSSHGSFRRCPRQWYYKKIVANARANDLVRKEAYRLSKLEGIHAWRGKIVDTIISETIIPSVTSKRPCSVNDAKRKSDYLFCMQRTQRLAENGKGAFLETEYGQPLTNEMFDKARDEIHVSLDYFYQAEIIWKTLRQASGLFAQRSLSFKHGDVTVQVVPDLFIFRHSEVPVIFDWKVNVRPLRDYWLQFVTGAIALARCTPHKDWQLNGTRHQPYEIELLEVQLLTGSVQTHAVTAEDVEEAEDFISLSAAEMQLACGENRSELRPEDFSVARDPKTCQVCQFRKMCWGIVS